MSNTILYQKFCLSLPLLRWWSCTLFGDIEDGRLRCQLVLHEGIEHRALGSLAAEEVDNRRIALRLSKLKSDTSNLCARVLSQV